MYIIINHKRRMYIIINNKCRKNRVRQEKIKGKPLPERKKRKDVLEGLNNFKRSLIPTERR